MASTVVSGEASESEEEELLQEQPPMTERSGLVVAGEVSESDDNDEASQRPALPPLQVDLNKQGDGQVSDVAAASSPVSPTTPRFDSLLHRKLRERNGSLVQRVRECFSKELSIGAQDLHTISQQMTKSQLCVQDISHNLRLLTNDLFHLEDKVDIVSSCHILPDIKISLPSMPATTPTSKPSTPAMYL